MYLDPLSPTALIFPAFRIALVLLGLLAARALWRRPRPARALAVVVAMHVAAWAVYVAPLKRLYAMEEHLDRSFNVGMAACVAMGHSAFQHTQVGFANLEPFWTWAVAALSLFRVERIMTTYHWLPPLVLVAVALGLYVGLRQDQSDDDAWERFLIVFAALGLSSFSLSQRPPVPPLWAGNFLLKPNHAFGWALVGVVAGLRARTARPWVLGPALGLLAWVFILDWAYVVAGLFLGTLLRPRSDRDWKDLMTATAISTAIALPYIRHLARDHNPFARGGTPEQIWLDPLGQFLAVPHWATLDLGVLLILGVFGALLARRRRSPRDLVFLGLLGAAAGVWLTLEALVFTKVAPEADEVHYFVRLAMSLLAGSALAAAARQIQEWKALRPGQGHVLMFAVFLPLTFPAYWDPPSMDRYYPWCLPPLRPKVLEYGRWVRENTPPDAIFLAGRSASIWIPALSGRRVLLTDVSRPPADIAERFAAEKAILTSRDPAIVREVARKFGITHVAVDGLLMDKYGEEELKRLNEVPAFEALYRNSAVRILRIR